MKEFLGTTKGKVIISAVTILVIAVIVAVILYMNRGYRIIAIEELNGITKITNGSKTEDAYVGLHFKANDDARVGEESDLTLNIDDDKYLYAEPTSHFWIEATGKQADSKTTVYMDEGTNLFRIDNKLGESESFNVETPNATMSVRGTVFRVSCLKDANGDSYTQVEVFEGEVFVQSVMEDKSSITDDRSVGSGRCVKVRSNSALSEFVEDSKGETVTEIEYKKITVNSAKFLGRAIDEGRELCISKELLYDYVGINPHDYSAKGDDELEPTCTEEGYYYPACAVCGELKGDKVTVSALGHMEYEKKVTKAATCEGTGEITYTCPRCKDSRTEVVAATGHNFVEGRVVEATCEANGAKYTICSVCKLEVPTVIPAKGHNYALIDESAASCTSGGSRTERCTICGDTNVSTSDATGHSYGGWSRHSRTCSSCGDVDSHSFTVGPAGGTCTICGGNR